MEETAGLPILSYLPMCTEELESWGTQEGVAPHIPTVWSPPKKPAIIQGWGSGRFPAPNAYSPI